MARLDVSLKGLDDYRSWSLDLVPVLQQSGVVSSDLVITLRHPLSPDALENFLRTHYVEVQVVRAEYLAPSANQQMQTWTTYVRNLPGTDFALLDETARNAIDADLTAPHGVVAVYGTAPMSQLASLNSDPRVLLADAAPGYLASRLTESEQVRAALNQLQDELRGKLRAEVLASARRMGTDALTSVNVEQEVERFFKQYPDMLPQVRIKVPDLWDTLGNSDRQE